MTINKDRLRQIVLEEINSMDLEEGLFDRMKAAGKAFKDAGKKKPKEPEGKKDTVAAAGPDPAAQKSEPDKANLGGAFAKGAEAGINDPNTKEFGSFDTKDMSRSEQEAHSVKRRTPRGGDEDDPQPRDSDGGDGGQGNPLGNLNLNQNQLVNVAAAAGLGVQDVIAIIKLMQDKGAPPEKIKDVVTDPEKVEDVAEELPDPIVPVFKSAQPGGKGTTKVMSMQAFLAKNGGRLGLQGPEGKKVITMIAKNIADQLKANDIQIQESKVVKLLTLLQETGPFSGETPQQTADRALGDHYKLDDKEEKQPSIVDELKAELKRLDLDTHEGREGAKQDEQAYLGAFKFFRKLQKAAKAAGGAEKEWIDEQVKFFKIAGLNDSDRATAAARAARGVKEPKEAGPEMPQASKGVVKAKEAGARAAQIGGIEDPQKRKAIGDNVAKQLRRRLKAVGLDPSIVKENKELVRTMIREKLDEIKSNK